jgi:hypothetical protein
MLKHRCIKRSAYTKRPTISVAEERPILETYMSRREQKSCSKIWRRQKQGITVLAEGSRNSTARPTRISCSQVCLTVSESQESQWVERDRLVMPCQLPSRVSCERVARRQRRKKESRRFCIVEKFNQATTSEVYNGLRLGVLYSDL